jgi:hypothetical protein
VTVFTLGSFVVVSVAGSTLVLGEDCILDFFVIPWARAGEIGGAAFFLFFADCKKGIMLERYG